MDRFVVGTGRCGSTLLSRMLDRHRDVVCLHEFYTGLDWDKRFQPGMVSPADLAEFLCAEQPVTTAVLARGYTSDEICYPFGQPQARHSIDDPLPWLLVTMLSRLSDDPETLYDEFVVMLTTLPTAPLPTSYRSIFNWLAQRGIAERGGVNNERAGSDQPLWIERSGSSIDYLPALVELFPDGRFLHIHRDGCEAALSIRAHPFYRLGVSLLYGLFPEDADEETLFNHVLTTLPPLADVGRYWSDQVLSGYTALGKLDRRQYCEVRFEDLVQQSEKTLERISQFFELPVDAQFLEQAASLPRGIPAPRFADLSDDEQQELRTACRPGQILLGREAVM